MRNAVLLAVLVVTSSILSAQQPASPFGLTMGMPLAELQKLPGYSAPTKGNPFATIQPPQPHPDFELYEVAASQTYGLCKVAALGKEIPLNSFGDRLKTAFKDITATLEERYGKPEIYDRLKPGSIWKKPEDWTMGLLKEERTLAALFEKTGIPGLAGVLLESVAVSTSAGHLRLSYESSNYSACVAEMTKAQNSVF